MSGPLDVLRRPDFFELLRQHIFLAAALLLGIAIALPVALAIRNTSLGAALAVNIGNIGRAVPSLASWRSANPSSASASTRRSSRSRPWRYPPSSSMRRRA